MKQYRVIIQFGGFLLFSIFLGCIPGNFQIAGTGSFTPEIPGWSNTILWHSSS